MTQENTLQATMSPAPPRHAAPAAQAATAQPDKGYGGVHGTVIALDSSALLQGSKAIAICHNGTVYRLQATRLGKLILTK